MPITKKNKKPIDSKTSVDAKKGKSKPRSSHTKMRLSMFEKTAQQTVPFLNVYNNGTIESKKFFYTKAYKLQDFNFRAASDESQNQSFKKYENLLNTFSSEDRIQIVINNRNIDEELILSDILCDMQNDQLNDYRKDLNELMVSKLSEGRNNLISDKYLVIGTKAKNAKEASAAFSTRIDREVNNRIKQIIDRQNITIPPMTTQKRIKCLHDIYNIGNESHLPENFNIEDYMAQGMTVKDIVAPPSFKFHANYFEMGDKVGRVLFLRNIPSTLSTDFMAEISDLPFNLTASVYLEPVDQAKAVNIVQTQMTNINMNVLDAEKRMARNGTSTTLISPSLQHSQEQCQFLMDDLRSSNQKCFFLTMTIAHYADDLEKLNEDTKAIISLGNRYLCGIDKLLMEQEPALNSTLPLCDNQLSIKRFAKTESVALFIPFNTQEIMQKHGIYYGLNALSKNLLMFNRSSKENKNPNGLILGLPGSGKSMTAKLEIISVLLTKDLNNEIYVLDPESEYVSMAMALQDVGASVIHLEPGSGIYVNPFDMDIQYGDDDDGNTADPVTMKSDYICVLCETAMSGRYGLSNIEKSIIDRCVRKVYSGYINYMNTVAKDVTIDTEASPTMNDFYSLLMEQPEPEAQNIALSLEIFCRGSFDSFAHKTNVDTNARFVVYDIRKIGTGMKELGLQVCLNHVWNKTINNFKNGIRTWIYIDEFHLLTKSESSSTFLMQIWKRARKWNGVPCAITQNVEDLVKTESARAIINNCEFVIMLSQSPIDRANLRDLYHISDAQLEYITNSPPGQGLIYNGQAIIPFINNLPEDSKIYKLISTRPEDVISHKTA